MARDRGPSSELVAREARRTEVADLVLARVPKGQMAQMLGVSESTIANDIRSIRREWKEAREDAYETYRAEEIQRLAALERAVWKKAMDAELRAVEAELAIMERRSALLGLDAPVKVAQSVLTGDIVELEIMRSEQQLAARRAMGVSNPAVAAIEATSEDPYDVPGPHGRRTA